MKKVLFSIIILFCFTGCFLDFHTNGKYAESAVKAWFSYSENGDNLGNTRKEIENISEIKDISCKYIEHSADIYIYKCKLVYTPIGETVIPLSKSEEKSMYVALHLYKDYKYTYRVYNSSLKEGIWKLDEDLNYGGIYEKKNN